MTWNWVYHAGFSFMTSLLLYCEAAPFFSWLGLLLDFLCLMANLLRFCMFPASIHDILNGRTPVHQCCQSLGPGWLWTGRLSTLAGLLLLATACIVGLPHSTMRLPVSTQVTIVSEVTRKLNGIINEVNKCPTLRMRQFVGWF